MTGLDQSRSVSRGIGSRDCLDGACAPGISLRGPGKRIWPRSSDFSRATPLAFGTMEAVGFCIGPKNFHRHPTRVAIYRMSGMPNPGQRSYELHRVEATQVTPEVKQKRARGNSRVDRSDFHARLPWDFSICARMTLMTSRVSFSAGI